MDNNMNNGQTRARSRQNGILGAVIGDIVGSRFEWNNHRSKDFEFLSPKCFFTDDSILTLGVADAILRCHGDYTDLGKIAEDSLHAIGRPYPACGYGGNFWDWMYGKDPHPYGSCGNGSAMRVSACGFAARSLEEAQELSKKVTEITHNHPEGIKGAEATAVAVFMAKTGSSLAEIATYIDNHYYPLSFTLDEIRDTYQFNEICQNTVPQAIKAFVESTDYEDAIRNAVSIGGDSDTLAAITGGIAAAYYGIPEDLRQKALPYLDERLTAVLLAFESEFCQ